MKNAGIEQPTGSELYFPYDQPAGSGRGTMFVVTRAKGDPLAIVGSVRRQLRELDPAAAPYRVEIGPSLRTLAEELDRMPH